MLNNLQVLEQYYKEYSTKPKEWIPDGIIYVDLALLHQLDLVSYFPSDQSSSGLTRFFHVIESCEKITLVNEHFVIWIVPEFVGNKAVTYTFIATRNGKEELRLDVVFAASGVYNTSRLVLRILEKFLVEIQENDEAMNQITR